MRAFSALARLRQMVREVLSREPWWCEFISAWVSLAWGLSSLVGPTEISSWPSMALLILVGGEVAWFALAVVLGAAQLVATSINHRWTRWGVAVFMCSFWCAVSLSVFGAVPWAPGFWVYLGWAAANAVSVLRLPRFER